MNELLARWQRTIAAAASDLSRISDQEATLRPAQGKWSIKEIIGHLIDSASNNHKRFVEAQLREDLTVSGYEQEGWVRLQRYQDARWPALLGLWRAFNERLIEVVSVIPPSILNQPRAVHNLDEIAWRKVSRTQATTLAYLIEDYVAHLEHHLAQVGGILEEETKKESYAGVPND